MGVRVIGHGNFEKFSFHILVEGTLRHGQDLKRIFAFAFLASPA
jgi:hypothetical protein